MLALFFLLFLPPLLAAPAEPIRDYTSLRREMVEAHIRGRGIVDQRILRAFDQVERHLFVPGKYRHLAYQDTPLPIDEGQSISQPYIVAIMTHVIAPDAAKRILEIGTGSGYQAAILAELVNEVYTIEINEKLAASSKNLLLKLGYKNISFKTGDGYLGWPEQAPFDGIIVTCAPDMIPQPLIDQLAPGGRMVIPVRYASSVQDLILIEKTAYGRLKRTNLMPVQFVPLIRGRNG